MSLKRNNTGEIQDDLTCIIKMEDLEKVCYDLGKGFRASYARFVLYCW